MSAVELIILAAFAAGAWFLWDSLKAREAANAAMRAACAAAGLLFLDDTVALASVRPMRNRDGRLTFRRVYAFEFSDTGHDRRHGSIAVIGTTVDTLDLGVLTDSQHPTPH
jgi:hypothetical protein